MQLDVSDLIGTPFVDGGRDPATGLDCWGLFMVVMCRIGQPVPDYEISCFDSSEIGKAARHTLATQWQRTDKPGPGVGVTLEIDHKKKNCMQHFGVCINKHKFIHTLMKTGCIITSLNDRYWSKRIKGLYKWKK
ncbi:MAG: NlpC/P60 family protein [Bacteroidota bacterium]